MHNVTRAHLVRSESPGDGDQDLDSVEEDDDDDDEQERCHDFNSNVAVARTQRKAMTSSPVGDRGPSARKKQVRQQLQTKQRGQWVRSPGSPATGAVTTGGEGDGALTASRDGGDGGASDDSSVDDGGVRIVLAAAATHTGAHGLAASTADRLSLYSIYVSSSPTSDANSGDDCSEEGSEEDGRQQAGEECQFLASAATRSCFSSVPPTGLPDRYCGEADSMSV
jgi:hypothetical protein